jgi:phosphotransferase system  glucose/maltose/N-acetylglucosamine-specific IIC component
MTVKKPVQHEEKNKVSLLGRLIDLVAGIFTPLLGAMAAAGVLKGLWLLYLPQDGWVIKRVLILFCMQHLTVCFISCRCCWQ